ncbi:pimeloyl-ACP methyl ester carboxylesterase [Lipingzhangella halophila]|uniref:Pimeloyl-ACP methyl ester carboxylesterase n=1 Tax=Lipingzhangella halophila TaxID=1783352 RepID=A0A7W7W132_9ACTN|nr:alpha/beta hydrolase [Lipingzhangella halophila]MBB4929893.1 pimeloyl-ACP methyl ester carboxylesterase [Lipingzhangella halophila]
MGEPISLWPGEFRGPGGRRVFVRQDGSGAAAANARTLYIHGLAGSAGNWTDLMGALSPELAGEAPDLPGFGKSPPPSDGDYSLDAYAATVADLIRDGASPVHLVGNSMGAATAVRVVADYPELVRTLTLISPALPDLWPRRIPYQMTGALIPVVGPAVYARIQSRPAEVRVQGMLDATFYDPASAPAERVLDALEAEREREQQEHWHTAVLESLRGLVAEYLRFGRRSLWRQAAEVQCPTLLIYSGHDKFVNPRLARRAARTFPRNRLVLLPEAGHLPMMESPERVARELRSFLRAEAPH